MAQLEDLIGTSSHRQRTPLERAIELYGEAPKDMTPQQECAKLAYIDCLAQVEAGLMQYREEAKGWKTSAFAREMGNSELLGKNLAMNGKPCPIPRKPGKKTDAPDRVEAHHIIPSNDNRFPKASTLRARLARIKVRIDDADNGVWLPKTSRDRLPKHKQALPHRRIHREGYYRFLSGIFATEKNSFMFRIKLSTVATMLQNGDVPEWVMLPKHMLPDE